MSDPAAALLATLRQRVPPELAERARTFHQSGQPPAPIRDASTVVLLRDRPGGIEAYLLRRVLTMAFAGGMHVFPGGRVDPADTSDDALPWAGPAPEELAHPLGGDAALARGLVAAAVRETFEECGVLLAGTRAPDGGFDPPSGGDWAAERLALEGRTSTLGALLRARSLVLRADLLRPWARWVTPVVETRRYDTRFFVAALPDGQQPQSVSGEADRMLWMPPGEALERHAAGELMMLPPTAFTLAELSAYRRVADVLEAARIRDTRPVMPTILVSGEEAQFLLPPDGPHQKVHDGAPGGPGGDPGSGR